MARTLLDGVTRGVPGGADIPVAAPAVLKRRMVKTLLRDLDAMEVPPTMAERVVRMALKAVEHTLDASDVTESDKTATSLIAIRATLATVVAIFSAPPAIDD
jgi:hypothetical protein